MKNSLVTLLFILYGLLSFGQADSLNMSQVGHLSYGSRELSDVWAYVDSSGTEWALVGVEDGESVVDLSDPSQPVEKFFLPGPTTTWRDLKTHGPYAYVTNETGGGLRIMDLRFLPDSLPYKDTIYQQRPTSHNLFIDNGYIYLAGVASSKGLDILDANSDPWNPSFLHTWTDNVVHDLYVRNDTGYLAVNAPMGMEILDFTNKNAPVKIGAVTWSPTGSHNTWLNDAGTVCFQTDEIPHGNLAAWDITDLQNITLLDEVGSSQSNGQSLPHNAHVKDDFVYTSYYEDGLVVFDGSRPSNLVEVAYYNNVRGIAPNGFFGHWGVWPWLPSGNIICTDTDAGLFIVQGSFGRAAWLEGTVTDSGSGLPLGGATISLNSTSTLNFSDNAGKYGSGSANSGTYQVTCSLPGFLTEVRTVSLIQGQVTALDFKLKVAPKLAFTLTVSDQQTGNPIPGAEVVIRNSSDTLLRLTDPSGQVIDSILGGTYEVIAGKWTYQTRSDTFNLQPGQNNYSLPLNFGYYDDCFFAYHWTVSGNATTGIWERGDPNYTSNFGTEMNPEDDYQGDFGVQCFITGNKGLVAGDDDVSNGNTILSSPLMDLSKVWNPGISFQLWFRNQGTMNPSDSLKVWVTNGIDSTLAFQTCCSLWVGWNKINLRLSDLNIAITDSMQVHFEASDDGGGYLEVGIDEFQAGYYTTVGLGEEISTSQYRLEAGPNPFSEQVKVMWSLPAGNSPPNAAFRVFDLTGREVLRKRLRNFEGTSLLSWPGKGIFLGQLWEEGQMVRSIKMVKMP